MTKIKTDDLIKEFKKFQKIKTPASLFATDLLKRLTNKNATVTRDEWYDMITNSSKVVETLMKDVLEKENKSINDLIPIDDLKGDFMTKLMTKGNNAPPSINSASKRLKNALLTNSNDNNDFNAVIINKPEGKELIKKIEDIIFESYDTPPPPPKPAPIKESVNAVNPPEYEKPEEKEVDPFEEFEKESIPLEHVFQETVDVLQDLVDKNEPLTRQEDIIVQNIVDNVNTVEQMLTEKDKQSLRHSSYDVMQMLDKIDTSSENTKKKIL